MANIERAPERVLIEVGPGGLGWATAKRVAGGDVRPNENEVEYVRADLHRGAVSTLETIRDRLDPLVNGGEPCAYDAEDVLELVTSTLNRLGGR